MNDAGAARLVLEQPRDLSTLLRDAVAVYMAHPLTFIAVGAVVVVPVELAVSGIGLGELSARYDESPSLAEAAVPTAVSFLVVAPLIAAICIHVLRAVAAGEGPGAGRAITEGFEAFTQLFVAVLLATIGVALGLLLLIVPGIYLAVRWYFVPQAVVIEGERNVGALTRSGEMVQGFWWRCFGVLLVANLVAAIPGLLIQLPFAALAEEADRQVFALIGETTTEAVALPFVALLATLLYYDLRARRTADYRP